jgi:hypothetical protein
MLGEFHYPPIRHLCAALPQKRAAGCECAPQHDNGCKGVSSHVGVCERHQTHVSQF